MIDVLYILGRGSEKDDLELRLSLRSLEQYAHNVGKVYIVGNCPDWAINVIHIPEEDTFQAWSNHFRKVFKAIDNGISENFLLMNDDFYMMKPFNVETYPYYVRKWMYNNDQGTTYQKSISETFKLLVKDGIKQPLAYNVHCPIIYNGKKFNLLRWFWEEHKREEVGFDPRMMYGNLFVKTGIEVDDPKVFDDKLPKSIGVTCCISSHSNSDKMLKQLEKIFNKPSKYERG